MGAAYPSTKSDGPSTPTGSRTRHNRGVDISNLPLPPHELRRLMVAADGNPTRYAALVARRLRGEPLQYVEGSAAFGPLDLVVDPRVLIPRPETEQLWELACSLAEDPRLVLDLGTGSGALALALAHRFPAARVIAVDASRDALDVAVDNGRRLDLEVEWLAGDLFDPVPSELQGRLDLVVSNPPYVAEGEWDELPEDVRREPRQALVAGPAGTEVLDRIAAEVRPWLSPGGWVLCEIGETQGAHVEAGFAAALEQVEVRTDLAGRDRFVIGRRGA